MIQRIREENNRLLLSMDFELITVSALKAFLSSKNSEEFSRDGLIWLL